MRTATGHALAIAASEASGLKENFGTMVKPLHAGLAARNGVLAALLAQAGLSASAEAIAGAQGFPRRDEQRARCSKGLMRRLPI
jgi:2-methylcitrate dehydratase PrpD